VFAAEFLASKTGTEFFSCSSDGYVKWWDIRKMSEPTEQLCLDVTDQHLGAVCLEFESTMPTRYMIGTEQGIVINGNKKGKTPIEKLAQTYTAHHGPVYTIKRNPFFPKYFMTVGDWTARVWSEDIRESPIMFSKYYDCRLTSGAWSYTRPAVGFTGRGDGVVDVWDYLHKSTEPVLSIQVSKSSPTTTIATDVTGSLVACGCRDGTVSLVQLSESLSVPRPNEKPLTAALFDRESSREKVLVGRLRELALQERIRSSRPPPQEGDAPVDEEEDPIAQAEDNFWSNVDPEKYSEMKAARADAEAAKKAEQKTED
jgi:dynein intermediate chain 2